MTARFEDLRQWIVALENAARSLLARQEPSHNLDGCHVKAEPCPKHGDGCARVLYGVLVDHFEWAGEDPQQLAARLVGTMLPRRP